MHEGESERAGSSPGLFTGPNARPKWTCSAKSGSLMGGSLGMAAVMHSSGRLFPVHTTEHIFQKDGVGEKQAWARGSTSPFALTTVPASVLWGLLSSLQLPPIASKAMATAASSLLSKVPRYRRALLGPVRACQPS